MKRNKALQKLGQDQPREILFNDNAHQSANPRHNDNQYEEFQQTIIAHQAMHPSQVIDGPNEELFLTHQAANPHSLIALPTVKEKKVELPIPPQKPEQSVSDSTRDNSKTKDNDKLKPSEEKSNPKLPPTVTKDTLHHPQKLGPSKSKTDDNNKLKPSVAHCEEKSNPKPPVTKDTLHHSQKSGQGMSSKTEQNSKPTVTQREEKSKPKPISVSKGTTERRPQKSQQNHKLDTRTTMNSDLKVKTSLLSPYSVQSKPIPKTNVLLKQSPLALQKGRIESKTKVGISDVSLTMKNNQKLQKPVTTK